MRPPALLTAALFASALSAQNFTLKSADLGGQATDKQVYNNFGCTGQNLSPNLVWVNPPAGTKSYAITLYDPDAPTGSGWWHWVVFDIPVGVTSLQSGAGSAGHTGMPAGAIQSMTDFGGPGYGGPCPPPGDKPHRYILTVYALSKDKLGLDAKAAAPMVGFAVNQCTLAQATLVFYCAR